MVYQNKEIFQVFYGGKRISKVYLGDINVFGGAGVFKATLFSALINGDLYFWDGSADPMYFSKYDTGVSDISPVFNMEQQSGDLANIDYYAFYIKNGIMHVIKMMKDGTVVPEPLDLGSGWTTVTMDTFQIYSSSTNALGYGYTVGIRNGRVMACLHPSYLLKYGESNETYFRDWSYYLKYDTNSIKIKKVLSDFRTGDSGGIKGSFAFALATDGKMYCAWGRDFGWRVFSRFSDPVTDIVRDPYGRIHCISGNKEYSFTPSSGNSDGGYASYEGDVESSRFPTLKSYAYYSIQDGVIYEENNVLDDTAPENFVFLYGVSMFDDGYVDDYLMALTADGKLYRFIGSNELVFLANIREG